MNLLLLAALVTALGAAALLLTGMALHHFYWRGRLHGRARAITDASRRQRTIIPTRAPGEGIEPLLGRRPNVVERWLRRHWPGLAAWEVKLAAAGFRLGVTAMASSMLALVLAGTGFLRLAGVSWPVSALLAAAGVRLGLGLALKLGLRRRRRRFLALLPDALGLMVRGLRAGVPVTECVAEVSREVADPLGAAFRLASEQVRLGQNLEEALAAQTRGLDLRPMHFLTVSLSIQRETGGNLAEILDGLIVLLRKREQMSLKISAMSSEARASAAIIGALPLCMAAAMWAFAPTYVMPLFITDAGRALLLAATVSLGAGSWLMVQMIRFERG